MSPRELDWKKHVLNFLNIIVSPGTDYLCVLTQLHGKRPNLDCVFLNKDWVDINDCVGECARQTATLGLYTSQQRLGRYE